MKNSKEIIYITNYDSVSKSFTYEIKEISEEGIDVEIKDEYIPKAKDRIYIYPESSVPRIKLKAFCEKNNVSIAKAKETANVFIMNSHYILENMVRRITYGPVFIKKDHFLNYLKTTTIPGDAKYATFINDIENSSENKVCFKHHNLLDRLKSYPIAGISITTISKTNITDDNFLHLVNERTPDSIYVIESQEKQDAYDFIKDKNVYDQNALLALLNDEIIIDEEMYEGFCNLFESSDKNDHTIAMEGMSNCSFLKSGKYILMLYYKYGIKMNNNPGKNHVNFRSLVEFFDIRLHRDIDIDDLTKLFYNKNLIDKEALILLQKEAEQYMKDLYNLKHFEITGLKPTKMIQDMVDALELAKVTANNEPVKDPSTL